MSLSIARRGLTFRDGRGNGVLVKPVIGTNYSGNTDFLSDKTGFAVPYKLRLVEPGEYEPGAEGQRWAEPDETAAAEAMRHVFDDQRERQMRGAAGKALV